MLNKNVCPNCGQLYDTNLDKCPLCGTAPQVVDAADPVQRKRITEAERKQRRAERKEAEQEAKRRRKDEQFMQDAEEERLYEEREARRKEAKRRRKEEKKAARRSEQEPEQETPIPAPIPSQIPKNPPVVTPAPARDGRKPMPEPPVSKDRKRVPRFFLILSVLVLTAALLVGGAYLLWKTGTVELSVFDKLAEKKNAQTTDVIPSGEDTAPHTRAHTGDAVPCEGITLSQSEITLTEAGAQTQLSAELSPADTTDELLYASSDATVVKVSPVGIVTAVGPGSAVITVSCGSETASCAVSCDFSGSSQSTVPLDVTELTLNKVDMTFFAAGENYVLSITNIPVGTAIEWKSLDESVCTVDNGGHVVAIGPGTTRVIAKVGELSTECWVRCRFE